jgi:hypothetical protein
MDLRTVFKNGIVYRIAFATIVVYPVQGELKPILWRSHVRRSFTVHLYRIKHFGVVLSTLYIRGHVTCFSWTNLKLDYLEYVTHPVATKF